jgi:hypothetical protein
VADLDEEYIRKMEDVLKVYERPYDPAQPVVCFDEKPVTLHDHVRPPTPAAPGRIAKCDNEYERCGTANAFCAVEPKAGRHFTRATTNRSAPEFAQAVAQIVQAYPFARKIHLVMDNLQYPLPEVAHRLLRTKDRPLPMESPRSALHSQAWELAESSRN